MIISWIIYRTLLIRDKPEKWSRNPTLEEEEDYVRLYREALSWREEHLSAMREVETESDGLTLRGEYYDFGADRAVIIIPGRMESCLYSCHYAIPYEKAGWNVLTIDTRAHGLSEGKVNCLGYREYRDVIAWANLLHDRMGISRIVLHGICIGSSTAVFTAADSRCPSCIRGIVADGMYQRFYDSCRNHMVEDHRPLFPFLYETTLLIRLFSHADVVWDGPRYRISKVPVPILFLHSREDRFSTPEKAEELYRLAGTGKHIHWFAHGKHSRLRITNPEEYDAAVQEFLNLPEMQQIKLKKER